MMPAHDVDADIRSAKRDRIPYGPEFHFTDFEYEKEAHFVSIRKI